MEITEEDFSPISEKRKKRLGEPLPKREGQTLTEPHFSSQSKNWHGSPSCNASGFQGMPFPTSVALKETGISSR